VSGSAIELGRGGAARRHQLTFQVSQALFFIHIFQEGQRH